jgi:hypothetical protein
MRPRRTTRRSPPEISRAVDPQLLTIAPWQQVLEAARSRIQPLENDVGELYALRSARTTTATAAGEVAQAARFEVQLPKLSGLQAEAAVHLESIVDDLLAGLEARLGDLAPAQAAVWSGSDQERFADDVVTAMRTYSDRIEQLLLDLGEAARAAVGVSMGASLPPSVSPNPPRPRFEQISLGDASRLAFELGRAVRRSVVAAATSACGLSSTQPERRHIHASSEVVTRT